MFGEGLSTTVGDQHKQQRKMLNPVFHTNHMRNMVPIFYDITHKLKDAISRRVSDGPKEIDVLNWLTRTALEMIGQGGFGHSFDRLEQDELNPLAEAIKAIVPTLGPLLIFYPLIPFLSKLGTPAIRRKLLLAIPWPRLQKLGKSIDLISEASQEILRTKRELLANRDEALMEQVGEGNDIMSVLRKSFLSVF